MMIDAEIYGMIPSAKIEKRCSAPPEKRLKRARIPPWFWRESSSSTAALMPGTGMWVPIRYTTIAPSRNSRRFFRSAYLVPLFCAGLKVDATVDSLACLLRLACCLLFRLLRLLRLPRRLLCLCRGLFRRFRRLPHGLACDAAACSLDGAAGTLGHAHARELHGLFELTGPDDLRGL